MRNLQILEDREKIPVWKETLKIWEKSGTLGRVIYGGNEKE